MIYLRAWPRLVFPLAIAACNGQFDFDTDLPDAEVVEPVDAPALDAGADVAAAVDARADVHVDSGLVGGRIICGATNSCGLPNRACCWTDAGSACIEPGEATCPGLLTRCDSASDCTGGRVCCATLADTKGPMVACQDVAACAGANQIVLCDPSDPTSCASCAPAAPPLPFGLYQCQP
jgi:hypothetical protein